MLQPVAFGEVQCAQPCVQHKWRSYKLMDLKQLSFKTDDPNMVTFHFKKEGMTDFKTHTASVTPTQNAQCVAAVKS